MKKYFVTVVGDIGEGEPVYNGQTAKTREYIYYLSARYGKDKVNSVDTRYWKKRLFSKMALLLRAMKNSRVLVLVLGQNGRRTILPFALLVKPITKNIVLFSIVGGSLMYELEREPRTLGCLHKTDGNYVETVTFKNFLEEKGVLNVEYAPVFSKREKIQDESFLSTSMNKPYRFCTYARVCKEKGISSAIDAIAKVNETFGETVCELDIYGEPQEDYKEEFDNKISLTKDFVHVYPYLDDTNAIKTLAEHYMMLFPTYYSGEGFPIAIIECLKAGVPVIASDWHFNSEVVRDGVTGRIYSLDDMDGLTENIIWAISHPNSVAQMKKDCLMHSENFEPDKALSKVYYKIDTISS